VTPGNAPNERTRENAVAAALLRNRSRYLGLAYRMLGSRADAEDVIQEAYLRAGVPATVAEEPERYLFRVVANLCIDRLRAERVRRRDYTGPWLPEPVVSDDLPGETAELAESLSLGLLLLLERLSPAERIVFVLREAFDLGFAEIAGLLGVSEDACRQRFARARRHLAGERSEPSRPAAQRELLTRLITAVAEQQVDTVVSLLADDALLVSDGGGVVSAAIRPVEGRERIARVLVHIGARAQAEGSVDMRFANINGEWGVLLARAGRVETAITVELSGDRVRRIFVVRNPSKLERVDSAWSDLQIATRRA
jgi:RNA polymerase sigma-70 factor (ECF subfamily)